MIDNTREDEVLFDRLVDGELSAAERQRLLAALDDRPGGWRRCALAFLEAQTWRGDLTRIVEDKGAAAESVGVAATPQSHAGLRRGRWLAIAACILVAFTLGLAMREDALSLRSATPSPGENVAVSNTPPTGTVPSASPRPADANDALTLYVRDEKGQTQLVRVPLVDAATLNRQMGLEFKPGLTAAARNHLRERGYDVRSKHRYAPLWLENGRPMIVPVEDTHIVPVNQPVY